MTRGQQIVAVLTALGLYACESTEEKRKPPTLTEKGAEEMAAKNQLQPVVKPLSLSQIALQVAGEAKKLQDEEAPNLAKLVKNAGSDAKVLKTLYGQTEPRFYGRDGQLNADGQGLLDLLADLERHGVDKAGYRLAQIDAATRKVVEALTAERETQNLLEKTPHAALTALAASQWLHTSQGSEAELARAGGDKLTPAGLEGLSRVLPQLLTQGRSTREAILTADLELTRAVIRYVVDFTLAYPAHPLLYTSPAQVRKLADTHADKVLATLGASKGHVVETLKKLWPSHPQYALLLSAYDRYKKLADAGGWQALPKPWPKKIQKGETSPIIAAMRERLRAEGYEVGAPGDHYDDELLEAMKNFQARHLLESDGVVGKPTLVELDVPAEQRVKQIQLALERYRESEGKDPGDFYIWVNIAFQQLWVYDDGKMIETHKVIVGNNDTDSDQQTQVKGKINRTRMFSQKMTRVILAPRWYPTQRVVELEMGPKMAKDPLYKEKEGIVMEVQPDGTEVVYQKAGKTNLLGDVKFQGPNKYNIYLHDTPFRNLFSKVRRTFSHGCIRVQNPVDLAELILGRDKGMSRAQIKSAIEEKEEVEVKLKSPIPVHIDYATVAVDDEGRVQWGADVYGYDEAFFAGALPVEEAKEFKASSARGL